MSSSYVVLARKWRSSQFEDIVGQTPVVRTLMNAIRTGRVHQAYLLTGTRGIGKTSIARILAKALRCPNPTWTSEDPKTGWLRSCGDCASCREITAGSSVDVIEIDGASNNGVDSVREIRENAKYLPSNGERKVYIVDEVHMLTTAAFNALLKTLEEPPPHVIFILATTEPHKIPPTILSRVQRFDLKRVNATQIQGHLSHILASEKIEAESAAISMIARAAEGSMRDALSLLDQVIAYSGNHITAASARESIGLVESQLILGILRGVLSRNASASLERVHAAFEQGHDLKVLARSLIEFLYGAILIRADVPRSTSLEFSDEEWTELTELAALRELSELELIFQALHQGVEWIARSPQPKIVLDVLLIKCALADALVTVEAEGGATPQGSSGGQVTARPLPSPAPVAPNVKRAETTSSGPTPEVRADTPTSTRASEILASLSAPASKSSSAPPRSQPASPVAVPSTVPSGPNLNATWEGFIAHVRSKRPFLATLLENAHCEHLPGTLTGDDENTLLLAFPTGDGESYKKQLEGRTYADQVNQEARAYFGRPVRIRSELKEGVVSLASSREKETLAREVSARQAAQNHPILNEARTLFGGELGPIELVTSSPEEERPSHA